MIAEKEAKRGMMEMAPREFWKARKQKIREFVAAYMNKFGPTYSRDNPAAEVLV